MKESAEALYWIGSLDKDGQLAISQCLDLETTRLWLKSEINSRFYKMNQEEEE